MMPVTDEAKAFVERIVGEYIKLAVINRILNHECNARLPILADDGITIVAYDGSQLDEAERAKIESLFAY